MLTFPVLSAFFIKYTKKSALRGLFLFLLCAKSRFCEIRQNSLDDFSENIV